MAKVTSSTKNVDAMLSRLANPRPFLDEVAEILRVSTVRRITTTKTSPDGQAWAPWAVATARARAKRGTAAGGLLNESGRLANSIRGMVTGKSAVVGSEGVGYAKYLQTGTNKMPARPFVGISKDDSSQIHKSLRAYLKGTK